MVGLKETETEFYTLTFSKSTVEAMKEKSEGITIFFNTTFTKRKTLLIQLLSERSMLQWILVQYEIFVNERNNDRRRKDYSHVYVTEYSVLCSRPNND